MTSTPTTVINACWKSIGVWGDRSCPELRQHTHCRNCPVYHAAGATLLDREPPPGYREDWTARAAHPREPVLAGTKSIVIFRLGAEWLALPIEVFQEVADSRPIHSLPHREGRILKGLVNIRGELLLCVSLADLLGVDTTAKPADRKEKSAYQRLLVVTHKSGRAVFPADEVHSGCRYHPDELRPVPATVSLASARYSVGLLSWRERNVGVLDPELVFYSLNRHLA
ncbi:MAG: purine-binding chemotaxis protein CheW [Verrucomicrobia bacterium]|nr:purine-binding chemotaxis protein CheW [Verrucomicrobiota bacterium]